MMKFSQEKLNVWMYKFLLGTLPPEKIKLLELELQRRNKENQIHSALERKLLAAFSTTKPVRRYLAELLDDWEKRNWGG